jgi:hypothetical protein
MSRAGLPGAGRLPGCMHARSAAVASGWPGPGQLQSRAGAREQGEDFADGGFLAGRFGQPQVRLDLVAVAAAVFLLHHVAGFGQAGDDAVGAALGDVQAGRGVAQPHARSWAMHSSTRAWLARKLQLTTLKNLSQFLEIYC